MANIERLRTLLSSSPGPLTRKWLSQQRQSLKSTSAAASEASEDASPSKGGSDVANVPVSALVLTPGRTDMSRLGKDYVTDGEPFCLNFSAKMADDAVLLAVARVGQLPTIAEKLTCWGFKRFSHVFLTGKPSEPDVIGAEAIAVCERGQFKLGDELKEWPVETDRAKLIERLLADVTGRRVHLFAKTEEAGEESIVDEANWLLEAERK